MVYTIFVEDFWVSQKSGALFRSALNSILGSILGSLCVWKLPYKVDEGPLFRRPLRDSSLGACLDYGSHEVGPRLLWGLRKHGAIMSLVGLVSSSCVACLAEGHQQPRCGQPRDYWC